MASLMADGIWPCTVQSASSGADERGVFRVQINVRIDDGPSVGRFCTYEDDVNAKSALYVRRSCKAIGWTGGKTGYDLTTLADDVRAWIEKTGGKSTVEIRHIPIKKGKQYDKWIADGQRGDPPIWDKANSIGRGPQVLRAASSDTLADADDAMRRAMEAEGGTPHDDVPHPADGEDIPFATCSTISLGEIAAVLK